MKVLLENKRDLEESLNSIERDIFEAETDYVIDTPHGNVIRGWEGFLDSKPSLPVKRKVETKERIFSHSSHTFWRHYIKAHKEQQHQHHHYHHQSSEGYEEMDGSELGVVPGQFNDTEYSGLGPNSGDRKMSDGGGNLGTYRRKKKSNDILDSWDEEE
ncbi:unnamed protein product [Chrysoparadoxa australica]